MAKKKHKIKLQPFTAATINEIINEIPKEADALTIESKRGNAEIRGINQNIAERKRYAEYIFSFTCIWCILVFFFLFFVALGKFILSDLVVTTLIGSTTLNVLVFFRLVTEYLFNKQKSTNF